MENSVINIEKKILKAKSKQNDSINIVKSIDLIGKEKIYYNLLQKHSLRIGKLDNELESLYSKKQAYKALMNEFKN